MAALVCLLALTALEAQVPQLINYQGRVAVGTVNFDGSGQFKFALVNAAGTTTYWSNDGTSTAGSEPTAAVTLTVTKGLYSVLLGDTTLPNMTIMPATVFTNPDVRLRVWFNDGTNGSQLLTPDQRIAAVGYAMMAGNVPDGAITGAKIAAGAVGSAQLAAGAVGSRANAGSARLRGGGGESQCRRSKRRGQRRAGAVRHGKRRSRQRRLCPDWQHDRADGDAWQQRANGTPPAARYDHTAVWTGSEMIVWGGVRRQHAI